MAGPDTGSPCIFPFTLDGVTYTECLESIDANYYIYYYYYYEYYNYYDYFDRTWCSTQVHDLFL